MPTAAWAVPVPWKNCGSARDVITTQRFDASVWPPQAGKPLTLAYTWTLTEPLTKGAREDVTTTGTSGQVSDTGLRFQPPIPALFDTAFAVSAPGQTSLPVEAGPYNQSLTLNVPTKKGVTQPLEADMTAFDAAGHQILCMQLIIPVK